ncbi:MAG: type II toxin-antitoxin system RelE/ParE family toxin [Paludibacteraceae bacterium]|nr:type II toxin-antitoxin system RelE/ParE family toxin [Paludibacteraceae bacterium]
MNRKIYFYKHYFKEFLSTLSENVIEKINYALLLLETQDKVSKKFVKYLRDDIFELRAEYESNIYRVFFIFDEGNIVVLFNGFQKKTQKTPEKELKKAIKLKEEYYATKP